MSEGYSETKSDCAQPNSHDLFWPSRRLPHRPSGGGTKETAPRFLAGRPEENFYELHRSSIPQREGEGKAEIPRPDCLVCGGSDPSFPRRDCASRDRGRGSCRRPADTVFRGRDAARPGPPKAARGGTKDRRPGTPAEAPGMLCGATGSPTPITVSCRPSEPQQDLAPPRGT